MSFACALGFGCLAGFAKTLDEKDPGSLPGDGLAAFIASLPKWSTSAAVKASYGYKDNLLLSAAGKEQSAFARGSVEMLVLRVPYGRLDYSFFAQAEGTDYFSAQTADHDADVYVRTEPGFRITETWSVAAPVTAYYVDKVFDVSDTEVERLVARLKVRGAKVGPMARWDFHPAGWLEMQATGERKRYHDGGNDGRVGEGRISLGGFLGDRLEGRLSGGRTWRDFDRRAQYSAPGRELPGTNLKIGERSAEVRFDIAWDDAAAWKTTTRASWLTYRDNGSGYFNYREQKIAHDVQWRNHTWLLQLGGSASRIDFAVQTVGVGIEPPPRLKDEFTALLRVERQLSKRWAVFGNYGWERARSNDRIASYTVNEGLLGLRWGWGK